MSAKTRPAELGAPVVPAIGLTVKDAASALSLGYDVFARDVLPSLKVARVGRRRIVPTSELQRWLLENAEKTL